MIHTANLGGGRQAFYNYNSKQRCHKRIERLDGMIEAHFILVVWAA
jgi:hypothetical protein